MKRLTPRRRLMLAFAVTGAALGSATIWSPPAVGQNPPSSAPVTQPTSAPSVVVTTQPAGGGIDELIKQMGSDDGTERDAAQQKLVDTGAAAVEALKRAAEHADDLEIRSRAAAALAQISEHDALDASRITLHLKDAAGQDALNAIAAQAHAQFAGMGLGLPAAGPIKKIVNLEADHKPFWDVMADICQQMNLCPVLDTPTKNTLHLGTYPRNWFLAAPHTTVGPYWLGVAGIYRMRTIDLMGPESIDDQFTMRFIIYPEPKLAVTQISDFSLKEATDDAGNSLVPTGVAAAPQPAAMAGLAIARSVRSLRQTPHLVETRLAYPEHPGKRISLVRGSVVVTLAQGVQQLVDDDVLGEPKLTNPVNHCTIKITVTHNGPEVFMVNVDCSRDGMPDEQWNALINRINDISLEDADGHPLTPLWYQPVVTTSDSNFRATAQFSKSVFGGQLLNRQVISRTGDAKRLTWSIATRLKTVTVPVTFKDLPMP